MELRFVFLIVGFVAGYSFREAISQFRRTQARQERRIASDNVASESNSLTSIAARRITDLVWAIAAKIQTFRLICRRWLTRMASGITRIRRL